MRTTLLLLLLASGALAQDDLAAKLDGKTLTMRTGSLTANVHASWPGLTIASPLGKDTLQPRGFKPGELKLIFDSPDRKTAAWVGDVETLGGELVQFTCVYEIRRGVEAVFVSSRLYNREDSMRSLCSFSWGFPVKAKTFESVGGPVPLLSASQKLKGVADWALFHKEGETGGLCVVTDGLDQLPRKFSGNGGAWLNLAANHDDDGLFGVTGIHEKVWKFAPGGYNEIKFVAFHAEGREDAAAMFKRLSEDPELAALWRY